MTKFQGQTDKVLKVQMKSILVSARWGLAAVAMGGKIPIEIMTQFVADGSDIKITLKDNEGSTIETLNGKMYSNFNRTLYSISKPNKTGGMYFEVELSAHSLKGVGPKMKVLPPVQISDLKWADDKGKVLTEVSEGQNVELSAKVKGPVDGTEAYISVQCKKKEDQITDISSYPVKVKEGKVSVQWKVSLHGGPENIAIKQELKKMGLEYFQPVFLFEVGCYGVTTKSPEAACISWVTFQFGPVPKAGMSRKAIFEMPDGSERKESVPDSGEVKIPISGPGKIIHKDMEV